jgi:hypothetical protein
VEIGEHAAQKFAQDQGVHQRRFVFGLDGVTHRVKRRVPAIDLLREIHFVGAAAIVIGAARPDGKPQGHRLERARLVAGNLEPFDLWRKCQAPLADRLRRPAAPLGEKLADAFTRTNQIDRLQHGITTAEPEPGFGEQTTFDTFHRERNRAAGANGVDTEFIASL